jgi:CRP/FNR family cyclic AMP-dependent transcriptional regulator
MIELIGFDLFNYMEKSEAESVLSHVHTRTFKKKTQIVTEGDDSHSLYFLLEGEVKVYLNDDSGKEIIINIHKPGDFFGELGLVKSIPRTASIVTVSDCQIGVMQEFDFKHCLATYPAFSIALIENLSTRLIDATETIRQLGLMDVYQRIAVTFLNLSEEKGDVRVIPEKLTQQNIANRVGASREMVARILKDLRSGGYITQDSNGIIIHKTLPHSW